VGLSLSGDSVGGTPTEAVETTALPKKSLMIGAPNDALLFSLAWRVGCV
jgi:hypothetical protein